MNNDIHINKKRLAIVSIYDSEGVIYDYLIFYLRELKKNAEKMIVISNGKLVAEGKKELYEIAEIVCEKSNEGFDAGAYKFAFGKILDEHDWEYFDEIVLSNDTCFGPFVPFGDVFLTMEKASIDFWGINLIDNHLFRYLQSNFLVFNKNTYGNLRSYFDKEIAQDEKTIHDVCLSFERGLFVYLCACGFNYGSYIEGNDIDPYKSTGYLAQFYGSPIVKKSSDYSNHREDVEWLLYWLRKNTLYDTRLIVDYYERKKNNRILMPENVIEIIEPIRLPSYSVSRNQMLSFIKKNKEIYIYGAGMIAQHLYVYFKNDIDVFKGFLVSDNTSGLQEWRGGPIYQFKEDMIKNAGVIVAMNMNNTKQVIKILGDKPNVIYICS